MSHLVIRASAGAGKTHVLSSHYLKLLRRGADPGTILATTFTRKAAGEILGRVLMRLAGASRDKAGAAELAEQLNDPAIDVSEVRRLLAKVASRLHHVHVSTIDSFFNRMATCFRYELGLPPSPRLVEENGPLARQLRRRAIDTMLADEDPGILVQLLRRLHHDAAQRRITDALDEIFCDLYGVYRQTDPAAWKRLTPAAVGGVELTDAIKLLAAAEPHVRGVKSWASAWKDDLRRATVEDWADFLGKGIAAKIAVNNPTYQSTKPLPEEVICAYRPMVALARAALVTRVANQTEATFALLHRFHPHYTRLRQEQHVLLFGDLPYLLGSAMDDLETGLDELYVRLDSRVQHLLLDEFQDTSPQQWRILRPFAQEIRRHGDRNRSFFCVGDVKQAIYGWRDGCAEIFDCVIDDLHLPLEAQDTQHKSYRSSPVIVEVVNQVFGNIADALPLRELHEHAAAWQRGFEPHQAHHRDRAGYVELAASRAPAADTGSDPSLPHLGFAAKRVAELAQAHPHRTIGVLVHTNAVAADILHKLRGLGVHASGEGGAVLDTDAAVELVLSALTMADHPGHSGAVFHVYHSPLAGTIGLKSRGLADADQAAGQIRRQLLDEGYAGVITHWAMALAGVCNRRSVERLTQLVELADQHDPALTLRICDFVEQVRQTAVEDPAPVRVRVMTIHKAKGLEFDITVLCELSRLMGQVHRKLVWQYRPQPTAPPAAVFRSVKQEAQGTLFDHDQTLKEAHRQEVGRRVADDLSALYVAMTRAKYAMHVILEPLRMTKKGVSAVGLHNACSASILRHQLAEVLSPPAIDGVLYTHGEPNWDRARSLPAAAPEAEPFKVELDVARKPSRAWPVVNPSALASGEPVDVGRLLDPGAQRARAYGARIHREIEAIEYLDAFDEDSASESLRTILAHPSVRKIFLRGHDTELLWRERPFVVWDGERLLRGTFDRVIVRPDRRCSTAPAATLIDFKTDVVERSTLEATVDRYRPQVETYCCALSGLLGIGREEIEAQLVFLATGDVVRL